MYFRVFHDLKLCPWSRCPYKFLCTSRVRRYLPFVFFPRIWILSFSCLLTWELSTSGLWVVHTSFLVLAWSPGPSSSFPGLIGYPKSCGRFSLALHGLRNTKLTGPIFTKTIGFGFAIGEPSREGRFSTSLWHGALLSDRIREQIAGCKRTSRNSLCWTNEEDGSSRHEWNSLWLACQQIGFWCQHIWFGSLVPNWFCQTTNQAQFCGFWTRVSLLDFVLW